MRSKEEKYVKKVKKSKYVMYRPVSNEGLKNEDINEFINRYSIKYQLTAEILRENPLLVSFLA